MEELNKKLAEWAGFFYGHSRNLETMNYEGGWHYPLATKGACMAVDLPNFTQSLDACFKWLEPKIGIYSMWRGRPIYISIPKEVPVSEHNVEVWNDMDYGYAYDKDSLAMAFCLAIEKLIDGAK